jgi:glycosyltransferase involved in cell wall biosynthesis
MATGVSHLPVLSNGRAGKPRIAVVGHSLNDVVCGAERSLLEILAAIDRHTFDVSCVFPGTNLDYLHAAARHTDDITIFPYQWWSRTRTSDPETVERFEQIFRSRAVELVHVNTITLMDPLIAARRLGIPSIVHARELIDQDDDLARILDDEPRAIVSRISAAADFIIANSDATHRLYRQRDRSFRLHNCVDIDRFDLRNQPDTGKLSIGIISSNQAKKGIEQFVELATLASRSNPGLQFAAIGPANDLTAALKESLRDKWPPVNLRFEGYVAESVDAIAKDPPEGSERWLGVPLYPMAIAANCPSCEKATDLGLSGASRLAMKQVCSRAGDATFTTST